MAVAVNTSGVATPATEARSAFAPTAVPKVHWPSVARPSAPVVTWPPARLPPPWVTSNVTWAPATGLSLWSTTFTCGATCTAVPAGAVWLFPALITACAATPASSWMGDDTTADSPAALKRRVRAPVAPRRTRSVNTACPLAPVRTSAVPSRPLAPLAMLAVTRMPRASMGAPARSTTCTMGCGASGAPLAALAPGAVARTSRAGWAAGGVPPSPLAQASEPASSGQSTTGLRFQRIRER